LPHQLIPNLKELTIITTQCLGSASKVSFTSHNQTLHLKKVCGWKKVTYAEVESCVISDTKLLTHYASYQWFLSNERTWGEAPKQTTKTSPLMIWYHVLWGHM